MASFIFTNHFLFDTLIDTASATEMIPMILQDDTADQTLFLCRIDLPTRWRLQLPNWGITCAAELKQSPPNLEATAISACSMG
jgi:hypothetical protein